VILLLIVGRGAFSARRSPEMTRRKPSYWPSPRCCCWAGPWLTEDKFLHHVGVLICLTSIAAASLHLIIRTGHVSLCIWRSWLFGAYGSTITVMKLGMPWPVGLLVARLAAAWPPSSGDRAAPHGQIFLLNNLPHGRGRSAWRSSRIGPTAVQRHLRRSPPYPFLLSTGRTLFRARVAVFGVGLLRAPTLFGVGRARRDARGGAAGGVLGDSRHPLKVTVFSSACALAGMTGSLQAHYIKSSDGRLLGLPVPQPGRHDRHRGMTSLARRPLGTVFMVTLPELLRGYVNLQQIMFRAILFATMPSAGRSHKLGHRLRRLLRGRRPVPRQKRAGMTRLLRSIGLSKSFGGRKPWGSQLRGRGRPDSRHHRAQRRRQDDGRQSRLRRHQADQRPCGGWAAERHGPRSHVLVASGLVRTFQATHVFAGQTVRENLLRGAFPTSPGPPRHAPRHRHGARCACAAEQHVAEVSQWLDLARVADQVASNLPYGFQKVLGMGIGSPPAAPDHARRAGKPGCPRRRRTTCAIPYRLVRERGISVVVIDHNMRFISDLCDHVLVMAQGRELAQENPRRCCAIRR